MANRSRPSSRTCSKLVQGSSSIIQAGTLLLTPSSYLHRPCRPLTVDVRSYKYITLHGPGTSLRLPQAQRLDRGSCWACGLSRTFRGGRSPSYSLSVGLIRGAGRRNLRLRSSQIGSGLRSHAARVEKTRSWWLHDDNAEARGLGLGSQKRLSRAGRQPE